MAWPHAHDFQDAVLNPESSFQDEDLRTATVVKYPSGLPIPAAGQFGIVYQMVGTAGKRWAVKCFTADVPGRTQRYQKIAAHLQNADLPFIVGFEYLEQGVHIKGAWYPILKMDWVEGQTLNRFIGDRLEQPGILKVLTEMWPRVARGLRDAQVTHADLQHGNVMLVPGKAENRVSLKLVDYDGMYLPSLAGTQSGESGHPGYQHPRRLAEGLYSAEVDRFSHLVIYTALRALQARGRGLWDAYNFGDNLLFTQADFQAPRQSRVLHDLWQQGPEDVRSMTGRLVLAAEQRLEEIPELEELMEGSGVRALTKDQVCSVDRLLNGVTEPKSVPVMVPVGGTKTDPLKAPGTKTEPLKPKSQPRIVISPPRKGTPPTPAAEAPGTIWARPGTWIIAALALLAIFFLTLAGGGWGLYSLFRTPPLEVTVQQGPSLSRHTAAVTCLAFSGNGDLLASGSADKTIVLWDPTTGEIRGRFGRHRGAIMSLALSQDGSRLVSAAADRTIRLWDTAGKHGLRRLDASTDSVAISDDGRFVTCAIGSHVNLWDTTEDPVPSIIGSHGNTVFAVTIDGTGDRLASVADEGSVMLWDRSAPDPVRLSGLTHKVRCVAFSPDGERVAAAGNDQKVLIWQRQDPKTPVILEGHSDSVGALAFSGDGTVLASAGDDKTIRLWEVADGKLLKAIDGLAQVPACVALSQNGRLLAAGVGKEVQRWQVLFPGEVVTPLPPVAPPPKDATDKMPVNPFEKAPIEKAPDDPLDKSDDKSPDKLPNKFEWTETQFGDWSIFVSNERIPSAFFINRKTKQIIQVKSDLTKWINHRDPNGAWRYVDPVDDPYAQTVALPEVGKYVSAPPPGRATPSGSYVFDRWKVKIESDRLEFSGMSESGPAALVLYRDTGSVFTYANRSYGPSLEDAKAPLVVEPVQKTWMNARFGEWSIFPIDTNAGSALILSTKTRQALWVTPEQLNYVCHCDPKDEWWYVPEKGKRMKQNLNTLGIQKYYLREPPKDTAERGSYPYQRWTVTVSDDKIEFRPADGSLGPKLTIGPAANQFTYAGRTFGAAGNEIAKAPPSDPLIAKGPMDAAKSGPSAKDKRTSDPPLTKGPRGGGQPGPTVKDKSANDRERLQGTWSIASINLRVTFKGDRFTYESFGKTEHSGTFSVNADRTPAGLDIVPDKGAKIETIYRLAAAGDQLELMPLVPGAGRPAHFAEGKILQLHRESGVVKGGSGKVLYTFYGRIDSPNRTKSHEVVLEANRTYIFEMNPSGGSKVDPCMELRDPQGFEVAADGGTGNSSRIQYQTFEGGRYRIGAGGLDRTTGSYTLTVRRE